MKKIILFFLCFLSLFSLVSCKENEIGEIYQVTNKITDEMRINATKSALKSSVTIYNDSDYYSGVIFKKEENGNVTTYYALTHVLAVLNTSSNASNQTVYTPYKKIYALKDENTKFSATLIGYDLKLYLAVVSFEASKDLFSAAEVATSTTKAENVVMASCLSGLDEINSITNGLVSNLQTMYFQTDCDSNYLSSYGAGVYNMEGKLVGILLEKVVESQTVYLSRLSIGVLSSYALKMADMILDEKGEVNHPTLGITIKNYIPSLSSETEELPSDMTHGVIVEEVDMLSVAYRAGIENKDIILKVDDLEVEDIEDISSIMYFKKSRDLVSITLLRKESNEFKEHTYNITLK